MPIDKSFRPKKGAHYNHDPLTDAISTTYGNSVSTFITLSGPSQVSFLYYDSPETDHIIMRDKNGRATNKRGYFSRLHDGIRCYKNPSSISLHVLFIREFINFLELPYLSNIKGLDSVIINFVWMFVKLIIFFHTISTFFHLLNSFLYLF